MPYPLPSEILIATRNAGKVRELQLLLARLPVTFRYLPDFSDVGDVDETGSTFEQNAILKAHEYSRRTGLWAIADDSGLEVNALGGAPGVFSARYGGESLPFSGKMALVLEQLENSLDRSARFACVMAIVDDTGQAVFSAEGICAGAIAESPRGNGGFGYDPIFIPNGFNRTFGELPPAVKQQISHRGKASAILSRFLLHFNDL